jgi:hypothetical protein
MPARPRARGTLRTPWNRSRSRRNPTPDVAGNAQGRAKATLRQGGLESNAKDPLRHVPLKEPYGAKSGAPPAETGTPALVTKTRKKKGRGQEPG